MQPSGIPFLDYIFNAGFQALVLLANLIGMSFDETVVLLVWVAWPLVALSLLGVVLWQRRRTARLEALLPDHWQDVERLTAGGAP